MEGILFRIVEQNLLKKNLSNQESLKVVGIELISNI